MGNVLERQVDVVKHNVMDAVTKQSDTMRSTQVALQIAFARDQFVWGSAAWMLIFSGAVTRGIITRSVPHVAAIPLGVGAFALCYIGDMAYGSKLIRVRHEAEHILIEERELLVPPATMPSRKLWAKEVAKINSYPEGPPGRISNRWYSPFQR